MADLSTVEARRFRQVNSVLENLAHAYIRSAATSSMKLVAEGVPVASVAHGAQATLFVAGLLTGMQAGVTDIAAARSVLALHVAASGWDPHEDDDEIAQLFEAIR